jgi:hypothetical protein
VTSTAVELLSQPIETDLKAVFTEFLLEVLRSPSIIEVNLAAASALEVLAQLA